MGDIYEDARRYDALTRQHFGSSDAAYWKAQAAQCAGLVLERACGARRLTVSITEQGTEIAGLNASEPMLALAREKACRANLQVDWRCASISRRSWTLCWLAAALQLKANSAIITCRRSRQRHAIISLSRRWFSRRWFSIGTGTESAGLLSSEGRSD